MKVFLVWAMGSPADVEVIAIFDTREKAEDFISDNPQQYVEGIWELDEDDFVIEEREFNKPIHIEF